VATVSRATAALEQMRREQAERHLLMARAFVGASHLAVRRELAMLEAETGPLKAIADEGCERGCYGLDGVFEEPSPAPPRG
jgi:hypothetical protein